MTPIPRSHRSTDPPVGSSCTTGAATARADAARPPDRLPRAGLGAGRRAARGRRAAGCGRSTSAATATATRPTRPATPTRGAASRPTRSPWSTISVSPAIRRSSRAATRRARPRCCSAKRSGPAPIRASGPTSRSCSPSELAGLVNNDSRWRAARASGATSGRRSTRRTTRTRRNRRSA